MLECKFKAKLTFEKTIAKKYFLKGVSAFGDEDETKLEASMVLMGISCPLN